jgi:ABC-type uncharacterized transport system permease subunit
VARAAFGAIAGFLVWMIVVTLSGFVLRGAWPAYAAVADAMTFTLSMMIVRLAIGAVATLAAGWVAGMISRRSTIATLLPGVLLLIAFIPQHISLWEKFPIWYHLTFLLSLVPLTFAGGKLTAGLNR